MNKYFSFFFLMFLAVSLVYAAPESRQAVAKFVSGEVSYQKKGKGKWRKVKVGTKIRNRDKVRTMVESQLELNLDDGSSLTLEENSVVEMAALLADGGATNSNINIKTGKILFNIKKLASKKSKFTFETLTATAAIRGTEGGIGTNGRKTFAYLETGRLELKTKQGGKGATISGNQIALEGKGGFLVRKLGGGRAAMRKMLDKLLADTTDATALVDSLIEAGKTADSTALPVVSDSALASGSLKDLPLQVVAPVDGAVIRNAVIELRGLAASGAEISSREAQTKADDAGRWALQVGAPDRPMQFTLQVRASKDGIQQAVSLKLVRELIALECEMEALGETELDTTHFKIRGTATAGAEVRVGAFSAFAVDGRWEMDVFLPARFEGSKTLNPICRLGEQNKRLDAFTVTRIKKKIPCELSVASQSVQAAGGRIRVSGTAKGTDKKLLLNYGGDRDITQDGDDFSYELQLEKCGTSIDRITLKLRCADGDKTQDVAVEYDNTSRDFNSCPPRLVTRVERAQCKISYAVSDTRGDVVTLAYFVNGDEVNEFTYTSPVTNRSVNMVGGTNNYELVARDQAGNEIRSQFNGEECYPRVNFNVELTSPTTARVLRLPPSGPQGGWDPSERITVRIWNLPDDDYRYIKQIRVFNRINYFDNRPGRSNLIADLRSSFINDVIYDLDVELARNARNNIVVQVEDYHGTIREKSKVIELRK